MTFELIMGKKTDWFKIQGFFREYVDKSYKNDVNTIRLSKANTREHNLRVCEVCIALLEMGVPFYTEVKLNNGLRPDIVCPTHIKKIIEVMHTETPADFVNKKNPKLPKELEDEVIFIHTQKPFTEKDIL